MKRTFCAGAALVALCAVQGAQARDRDPVKEAQRWEKVSETLYHSRPIKDAGDQVTVATPDRAMDAALMPLTIMLHAQKRVTALTIIVDNNPVPVVGTFHFGPAITPDQVKLRVRIDDYTPVHAVAETEDGELLAASHYVQAAGGCSAPSYVQSSESLARMGQMQLRRTKHVEGMSVPTELLLSHPNIGMQTSPTGGFIPSHLLETISVKTGGVTVFDFKSGASLSEDPVINFNYTPAGDGGVDVAAHDSSGADYTRHFDSLTN